VSIAEQDTDYRTLQSSSLLADHHDKCWA